MPERMPQQLAPFRAPGLELVLRAAGGSRDAEIHDALSDISLGRAQRVSRCITAGFERPETAEGDWAREMTIVDRQIALFRLAFDYGTWPAWFVTKCETCSCLIDIRVGADEFEMMPAAKPAPAVLPVPLGAGKTLNLIVPGGAEEERLEASDGTDLLEVLASGSEPKGLHLRRLEDMVEDQLAQVLPTCQSELRFDCPECGSETGFWFDPLDWIARHTGQIFSEVHRLAQVYGWRESDILEMAATRRAAYLAMIEASA